MTKVLSEGGWKGPKDVQTTQKETTESGTYVLTHERTYVQTYPINDKLQKWNESKKVYSMVLKIPLTEFVIAKFNEKDNFILQSILSILKTPRSSINPIHSR